MKKISFLFLIINLLFYFGCISGPKAIETDILSLQDVYNNYFDIGAAIEPYQFQDSENERELLIKHFSSITPENVMKFLSVHPEEDVWTFDAADSLVEFALEQGMKIRGHCLVWHRTDTLADWIFTDDQGNPASRELMLERLETHIKTLVGRYKGKIYCWDVVNEPMDISTEDNLRHSIWYELIGPDYIEYALRFAHEADPDALLFINSDYTSEEQYCNAIIQLVNELRAKGVPIHGLGLEMHISLRYPTIEAIEKAIIKYRKLGLEIHITELDMSLYMGEFEELTEPPEDYLILQAYRYKALFDVFKKYSDRISNVTFWGFNDSHTWLRIDPKPRMDWPLLFDDNLKAKYAYWAVVDPEKLPPDQGLMQEEKSVKVYKASRGTPILDGNIDEIWQDAPIVTADTFVMSNEGATAQVRILWDEEHLYVLAEVTDPLLSDKASQVHEEDSFEVFLDENNGKTPSFESNDFQYRVNYLNVPSCRGYSKLDYFKSATVITDYGYLVELIIDFQTITGEAGIQLGLELQVNDDFGDGRRSSISKWNDPTNESWRNTSGWGILELIE